MRNSKLTNIKNRDITCGFCLMIYHGTSTEKLECFHLTNLIIGVMCLTLFIEDHFGISHVRHLIYSKYDVSFRLCNKLSSSNHRKHQSIIYFVNRPSKNDGRLYDVKYRVYKFINIQPVYVSTPCQMNNLWSVSFYCDTARCTLYIWPFENLEIYVQPDVTTLNNLIR